MKEQSLDVLVMNLGEPPKGTERTLTIKYLFPKEVPIPVQTLEWSPLALTDLSHEMLTDLLKAK